MKVAQSFQGYNYDETKAYEKSGKLYVKGTCKCGRCTNGVFVLRVENGIPVPHPNDGGVCYQCGGTGIITKEFRLYTDEEYARLEKSKVAAAQKKKDEQEKKMKEEFAENRKKWLKENGFNDAETTYIYSSPDSFDVKDTLKALGFKFNAHILWHTPSIPAGYEDKVIEIKLAEVAELGAWGSGNYLPTARKLIDQKLKDLLPTPTSEWIGEDKERLRDIPVTLSSVRGFNGQYGYSQIVRFETTEGNIIKWYTATEIRFQPGDSLLLTATVKNHIEDKYENDAKVTIVTRAKLVEG